MNSVEKRSFYSFLALYLSTSLFFVLLSGFWYFSAQKNSLQNTSYYKLQHIADTISGRIIHAHMTHTQLTLPKVEDGYSYTLLSSEDARVFERNYFEEDGFKVLVSAAPQGHLNIKYVVVKTDEYHNKLHEMQREIFIVMLLAFSVIGVVSYFLAKLFMRPMRQKIKQIEQFIQDISHELNTPITALRMSSQRAMQKGIYDKKILTNISISTKQLYSIYTSLSYLNFHMPQQVSQTLNLRLVLEQSIAYYAELSGAKNIHIVAHLQDAHLHIIASQAELLFSNLIANAIKYSMPETTITLVLKEGFFSITDEGVGIEEQKLESIFEIYARNSKLAGGFGIGLSIVKKICKEFDIAIEVTSQVDKGSCFVLRYKTV